MAKQIKQFRFYNSGESNLNQPKNLSKKKLSRGGDAFKDISSITQLGIQTLPGVRVYINGEGIIVGPTGIFELDIDGISEISEIYFDGTSLEMIEDSPTAYLIIDMICESKGG